MAPKTATKPAAAKRPGASSRPRSAPRSKTKAQAKAPKFKSRAVLRLIEAGSGEFCTHCDEQVKFKAREKHLQAICNVYVRGRWDRVEHYHEACYTKAGQPYGEPAPVAPRRAAASPATPAAPSTA